MKTPEKKYLSLILRAKKARSFIAHNPGLTYEELRRNLYPMAIPIAWLFRKGYIRREGGAVDLGDGKMGHKPVTYYVRKIGSLSGG